MALNLFDRNQYTESADQYNQPASTTEVPAEQPAPATESFEPAPDNLGFDDEYRERTGPRWGLLAGLIAAALVVAVGLVFGGRWVYNKLNDKPPITVVQPASRDNLPAAPDTGAQPNNSSSTANPNSTAPNTGATNPSPTPSGQTPTPSAPSNTGELPNNGPGSVLALFIGSSLAAAGLHYVITLRNKQYGTR